MFPTQTIPPLCLFLLLGGCAETNDYPMTSYRNATDLQFQTAASYDNFDVLNDGTIAVQVAASAAVRDYAVELMTDRRAAQAALKKIADSVNQQLPQQPESGDLDRLLVGLPGSALDTIYLRETMMPSEAVFAQRIAIVPGWACVPWVAAGQQGDRCRGWTGSFGYRLAAGMRARVERSAGCGRAAAVR